jgi:hypothetical protein
MSVRRIAAGLGVAFALMLASTSPALAAPGSTSPGNGGNCPTGGANSTPGGCYCHFNRSAPECNTDTWALTDAVRGRT